MITEKGEKYLAEEGGGAPAVITGDPRESAESEARVRERLEMFVKAGLAYYTAGEWVEPTTWGRLYLEGDLDARH